MNATQCQPARVVANHSNLGDTEAHFRVVQVPQMHGVLVGGEQSAVGAEGQRQDRFGRLQLQHVLGRR